MTTFNGWNMRYWIVWHATATSVCISSEKTQWSRVPHSKHYTYIIVVYTIYILYYIITLLYSDHKKRMHIPKNLWPSPAPSHPSLEWVDPHFFGTGYSMSDISMWIKMLDRTMYIFDILCWVDVSQPRNYQRFASKTVELLCTPPWHGDTIAQLSSRFISYVARSKPASRPLADLHTRLRE